MAEDKRSKRVRFTTTRLANLACPKGIAQTFLWDSEAPGLGIRATPNSSNKTFIFQSRYNNNTLRLTIGSIKSWSIHQAQQEASRLQLLIDNGDDPREVKRDLIQLRVKQSKEKANLLALESISVSEAWNDYYNEKSTSKKDGKLIWGEKHKEHLKHFLQQGGDLIKRGRMPNKPNKKRAGILYPLMKVKLSELNEDIISSWLREQSLTAPTSTAKAYSVLRAFINWCAEKNKYKAIIKTDVLNSSVVKNNIIKPKSKKNDCLRKAQLAPWFKEVRNISNPIISAYLQCLVLTGARRNELTTLLWKDVDFKWKSLTIRDKVEGIRTIPLTPYVEALISSLPKNNRFVFSSLVAASGHVEEPRKQHARAIKNASLPPLSIHGLRRSFSTLAEWVEVPSGIVAQIMGHKPSAVQEKHYIQRELDILTLWHIKIEKWMLKEAVIKFSPKREKKE
jgi:integrase